jgi:hypothetical protein
VIRTRICDLFGVRYPIVQTGMGWVAGPRTTSPVARSNMERSMAAPLLCREPWAGLATKIFMDSGVASQNMRVTYQGLYPSWRSRP